MLLLHHRPSKSRPARIRTRTDEVRARHARCITPRAFRERTTRIERASPGWKPGALPSELRPRDETSTPGWSRTSGRCRRGAALCPLSYGRVGRSLRQESNPHLGLTTGACLPLNTTEANEWRRRESNPLLFGASEALSRTSFIPGLMRTGGVEPPQPRRRRYRPVSSPVLSIRVRGWPAGLEPAPRGSRPRMLPTTPRPQRGRPGSNRRPLA